MAIKELVKGLIGATNNGPKTYHCDECGRTFEVDAPPSRVICSDCGNKEIEVVPE